MSDHHVVLGKRPLRTLDLGRYRAALGSHIKSRVVSPGQMARCSAEGFSPYSRVHGWYSFPAGCPSSHVFTNVCHFIRHFFFHPGQF